MGQIDTVRGPIDARDLGMTLMHEHIFIKNQELEENYPNPEWDEDRLLGVARDGLNALHLKGIRTMVDLTVLGLGRSIPRIQRLAETVEMNIVVATGYYTAEHLSAHFKNHGPGLRVDAPEPLDELFRRDIEDGIAGTGVKAGVIKVVTDEPGITPDVGRILASAARTQLATGVPISTHTSAVHQTGLVQQEFFAKHGVDLDRVVIGHSGDTTDLDYLKRLIDNGSPLGLDRFGLDARLPEADRIDVVVKLVELGYAERITLSHDASFFSINVEPSHRAPEWNHAAISDRVLPALRQRGVSDAAINQIMVANPARILSR
jgi:phosphotriesterase-related protein